MKEEMLKNFRKKYFCEKGVGLLEAVFALAISLVCAYLISLYFLNVQLQTKNLNDKVEYLNSFNTLQMLISRGEDCDCQFKDMVFNSTQINPSIEVTAIKMSCAAGAPDLIKTTLNLVSTGPIEVDRIYIQDIVATSNSNEYISRIYLEPKTKMNSVKYKTHSLFFKFWTDPNSIASNKKIMGCGSAPLSLPQNLQATPNIGFCDLTWSASSGAAPITYFVKFSDTLGDAKNGNLYCQSTTTNCAPLGTPLVSGTTYYFSIQAMNPWKTTKFSSDSNPIQSPYYAEVSCTAN